MPKLASACSATVRSAALEPDEFETTWGSILFRKNWTALNHFLFDFFLFGGRMLNISHRETGHAKLLKQLYPRLDMKTMANRFVEICKCVSKSQIKFGNIQNHSFLGRKEKISNNFQNHESKINNKNISNPRIWVNILCPNSHRLVAQRLDLPL